MPHVRSVDVDSRRRRSGRVRGRATLEGRGGADVLVLDKERFPRHKLCAGWITPQVVADLQLEIADLPARLPELPAPALARAGACTCRCRAFSTRSGASNSTRGCCSTPEQSSCSMPSGRFGRDGDGYDIDGTFRCRYLIGAGGTSCPVRRALFERGAAASPQPADGDARTGVSLRLARPGLPPVVLRARTAGLQLVRAQGGGLARTSASGHGGRLKRRGEHIRRHWRYLLTSKSQRFGISLPEDPPGYSYYLRGPIVTGRDGNAFMTGDSAGLATRDLCEGIGPAIRSGHLAAQSILSGTPYELKSIAVSSLGGGLVSRWMDWAFTRGVAPAA